MATESRCSGLPRRATVALLVALHRADLISRLVLIAGVFDPHGWAPGVIDLTAKPPEFLERTLRRGVCRPRALPGVVEKLAEMHAREPTLTARD